MNKNNSNREPERPVGYCNPPKHSQFQKGQSGNPKGCPKKRPERPLFRGLDPMIVIVLEHAARELTVRTANGDKMISQFEAALEKLFKMGMEGHYRALMAHIQLVQNADTARKEREAELIRALQTYDALHAEDFETAEREGKPVPKVFPNPRDIVLDHSDPYNPFRIVGPVNWRQQKQVDEWERERDKCDRILEQSKMYDGVEHEKLEDWKIKELEMRGEKGLEKIGDLIPIIKKNRAKYNDALPPRLQKPPPE